MAFGSILMSCGSVPMLGALAFDQFNQVCSVLKPAAG